MLVPHWGYSSRLILRTWESYYLRYLFDIAAYSTLASICREFWTGPWPGLQKRRTRGDESLRRSLWRSS